MAKSIYSAEHEAFLKVLSRIRSDAKLTQDELAERMGMSQPAVSDILRGQRRIDVIEWIAFCKACSVTPEQFLKELTFVMENR